MIPTTVVSFINNARLIDQFFRHFQKVTFVAWHLCCGLTEQGFLVTRTRNHSRTHNTGPACKISPDFPPLNAKISSILIALQCVRFT